MNARRNTRGNRGRVSARIYLDHAATTPVDPRVIDAMLPWYRDGWGNPSGIYREAQTARHGLDEARSDVAAVLECSPREIVFTAGGTEADNYALRGVASARRDAGRHVVGCVIEHHAILHTLEAMEQEGFEVTALFDSLSEKVSQKSRGGVPIYDIHDLRKLARRDAISIVVIAVPAASAQHVVDLVVASGIKAVLNFSPGALQAPPDVKLKNVDLTVSLESLSFYLARGDET